MRKGLTLVEALIVIGVVGLLASLLLPAVQAAREAARRARCANNLRQLGAALHNYEGSCGMLPPAPIVYAFPQYSSGTSGRVAYFSAQTALLSHLEQIPLHNAINFQVPTGAIADIEAEGANATAASAQVSVFICPTDPWAYSMPYGPCNYRVNAGVCGYCRTGIEDGAFNRDGTRLGEFTDGLSSTLAFSEKLVGGAPVGSYAPNRDWINGGPPGLLVSITAPEWVDYCAHRPADSLPFFRFDAGRTWMLGGTVHTRFLVSVPPNSSVPDCGDPASDGVGVFAARSLHPGGVNAVMADGSVRFVTQGIDAEVWSAHGTRQGGELIPGTR